ncbi:unnamed protein product [Ectocarpus sp. 12 AP-2014]
MITLRSTLTACPDSVFTAWFNGNWKPTEKDLYKHGRRMLYCKPTVFAKVLDVLRMKKGQGGHRGQRCGREAGPRCRLTGGPRVLGGVCQQVLPGVRTFHHGLGGGAADCSTEHGR